MDMDIYSPSIPKFTPNPKTTDSCTVTNGSSSKQKLFQLMDEKDKVEHELKALGQVLDSVRLLATPLFSISVPLML